MCAKNSMAYPFLRGYYFLLIFLVFQCGVRVCGVYKFGSKAYCLHNILRLWDNDNGLGCQISSALLQCCIVWKLVTKLGTIWFFFFPQCICTTGCITALNCMYRRTCLTASSLIASLHLIVCIAKLVLELLLLLHNFNCVLCIPVCRCHRQNVNKSYFFIHRNTLKFNNFSTIDLNAMKPSLCTLPRRGLSDGTKYTTGDTRFGRSHCNKQTKQNSLS